MEDVRFCSKRTLHPDIKDTSVYLHDTRDDQQHDVKGESGWVQQGVISRASFRRLPHNGKSFFSMMSLHINNQLAKKRGIGKKLLLTIRAAMPVEHVDLVALDVNGAAWRRPCGNDRKTHQYRRRSCCRYRLDDATWPHNIVEPRCSAK